MSKYKCHKCHTWHSTDNMVGYCAICYAALKAELADTKKLLLMSAEREGEWKKQVDAQEVALQAMREAWEAEKKKNKP